MDISTQNMSKSADTCLEFVQHVSIDGKKMVVITEEDVADEVSKKVMVLYMLGAKQFIML